MIVGLAPGKDGADLTGIPFTRDPSGQLINEMLLVAGLSREEDVFITNLVKCNPKDDRGRNRTPSKKEIENCLPHLRCEISYLKPRIVVPLGRAATEFILNTRISKMREFHGRKRFKEGIFFFPFIHPGYVIRGAYNRGKYLQEFNVIGDTYRSLIEQESLLSRLDILLLLLEKASNCGSGSFIRGKTKMQKLLFLVQEELRDEGYRAKYAFRPYLYGPYSRGLYTDVEWLRMNGLIEVRTAFDEITGLVTDFSITESGRHRLRGVMNSPLHENIKEIVGDVIAKYSHMNVAQLVEFVHNEYPDYNLRQREKSGKHINVRLDSFI